MAKHFTHYTGLGRNSILIFPQFSRPWTFLNQPRISPLALHLALGCSFTEVFFRLFCLFSAIRPLFFFKSFDASCLQLIFLTLECRWPSTAATNSLSAFFSVSFGTNSSDRLLLLPFFGVCFPLRASVQLLEACKARGLDYCRRCCCFGEKEPEPRG